MSEYKAIFDKNIERVESLNALYVKLKQDEQKDSKDYKLTDILRSEVVFLHSAFEEYFRCVLIEWLPVKASDETLKENYGLSTCGEIDRNNLGTFLRDSQLRLVYSYIQQRYTFSHSYMTPILERNFPK